MKRICWLLVIHLVLMSCNNTQSYKVDDARYVSPSATIYLQPYDNFTQNEAERLKATHEFIHTYYGYGHCPKDSTQCIMKDAKGKADFSNKIGLCKTCREKINI